MVAAVGGNLLVEARGLVKEYRRRRVVNGVNMNVREGEIVGLLGPNGAGKTTSFYMITGLIPPTEGRVMFKGRDVTRLPMFRRARMGLGYLAQEPSIFRNLTVEENVLAILETLPLGPRERRRRLEFLLEELKISYLARQKAYTLSGGERRRLEITRALVTDPALILLDEPFSGVDPLAVYDVQQIIRDLKQRGLGILVTDHNVRETLSVVDRAYVIYSGEVLTEGTREFLVNDPQAREKYLGREFSM
ncbi:MAG: LPS export ABC transporter ATP-binding protein [Candidatus Hydrogenedentes bacterium]|nr:LPS export ABC transporter ATP-binding protein [Candidatus Hydrogenedentota bacterium]HOU21584.1 LPS export ABC transporter ATP-binding protein [Kiritimatiellia bacterium]HPC20410.1 LPS export ABC transporter ATP-binding protein [Kiritimatiellia bacterium]HQN80958.1 LPS export ABC transporter ATP-binding protein [Kiritimatiellia bacterium]HQQ61602.1 LPS export ABC transporter ATP-binding protein [Kiritimatiellia bacterium]